ncbi:FAD_binding_3 domain-containing protein [Pseudozyma hubeiensis]|nr:FAD_binding_3 domain-containing protein [Pseudozyma hubeiensis]
MRVLISGAGIAGPTLAHFLSRAGSRITVVEKAPSMLAQGQNIDVHGTALNVINKMNLLEEVRKHNTTEKGFCLMDRHGRPFARMPVNGSAGSPTSEFEILRGDLADVIYRAVEKLDNVEFRFGTTVSKVLENGADKVRVELSSGVEEEYDILVAADGQWSRLRKEVFGEEAVTVRDMNCFVIYATIPRTEQDSDYWEVFAELNRRGIQTRPDNHGTTRACLTIMPRTNQQKQSWFAAARSHDRKLQMDVLRSEFRDAGWKTRRILDGMETADDLYFQAIQQIRMDKWHKNRVICLGDTAYAPTPFTGMGTSLAINGAYLLAGHLSKLAPNHHPSTAFEEYETQFRPFVKEIQDVPSFIPGIAHPTHEWQRWLFQSFLAAVAFVVTRPWIARWAATKGKKVEEGLVDVPDAPFPQFAAFEQANDTKA